MADSNPFDLYLGLVLARLYEARPQRLNLEAPDFGLPAENVEPETRDLWIGWSNTVDWLQREGYIRHGGAFSGSSGIMFAQAELTEKGFRALNSLPAGLKGKGDERTFGSQLVELGKKTGWRAATKLGEKGADEATRRIVDLVQQWMS